MKIFSFKTLLIVVVINVMAAPVWCQSNAIHIAVQEESFFVDLKPQALLMAESERRLCLWLGLSDSYGFSLLKESRDNLGFEHRTYQQFFKGVRLEAGMLLLHGRNGIVTSLNGSLSRPHEDFRVGPVLQEREAVAVAVRHLNLMTPIKLPIVELVITGQPDQEEPEYVLAYKVQIEGKRKADSTYTRMQVFVDATSGEVINQISLLHFLSVEATAHTLYSGERTITADSFSGGYRLYDSARKIVTYDFSKAFVYSNGTIDNLLDFTNPSAVWNAVPSLDSVTLLVAGDTAIFPSGGNWLPIFFIREDSAAQFFIQGPIPDYRQPLSAPAGFVNIDFNLSALPYQNLITAYNRNNANTSGEAFFVIDSTNASLGTHSWSDTVGNSGTYSIQLRPNPALDAHWGMERTYDYYKEVFDRDSYDGNGGEITNLVNAAYAFTGSQAQAAAMGRGLMVFGLGDRYQMSEVVSLDVMGHEFTHMVISQNGHGGLAYQGESGALNESFADIFGTCIEFYAKGQDANWEMGEDIFLRSPGLFRSMADPKITANTSSPAQPDTYEGQYWADPGNLRFDNGGVHINSGVQNKWFYLLCEGGTGVNDNNDAYQVSGIGIGKAQEIAYRTLTTYLTPYVKYTDAYRGSLEATQDLYGDSGPEYSAVKAAWFAVGIGDEVTGIMTAPKKLARLKIYPNPAREEVTISSELKKPVKLSVMNMLGRVINIHTIKPGSNVLPIRSLAKGTYLLKYEDAEGRKVEKLSIR